MTCASPQASHWSFLLEHTSVNLCRPPHRGLGLCARLPPEAAGLCASPQRSVCWPPHRGGRDCRGLCAGLSAEAGLCAGLPTEACVLVCRPPHRGLCALCWSPRRSGTVPARRFHSLNPRATGYACRHCIHGPLFVHANYAYLHLLHSLFITPLGLTNSLQPPTTPPSSVNPMLSPELIPGLLPERLVEP